MPKHDFLLGYLLESVFDSLSDEQAGQLIKATFDYEVRREEPAFEDRTLQFVFDTVIKPKAEENMEKYKQTCESRRKNIKSRWDRVKAEKAIQMNTKDTNEYKRIQMNTNDTNDTNGYKSYRYDIDNDNDKSLSISTECQSETEKIVRDFSQVIGKRKISVKKRFELMSKYKEMRAEKPKEEVDQALLDYLAQE